MLLHQPTFRITTRKKRVRVVSHLYYTQAGSTIVQIFRPPAEVRRAQAEATNNNPLRHILVRRVFGAALGSMPTPPARRLLRLRCLEGRRKVTHSKSVLRVREERAMTGGLTPASLTSSWLVSTSLCRSSEGPSSHARERGSFLLAFLARVPPCFLPAFPEGRGEKKVRVAIRGEPTPHLHPHGRNFSDLRGSFAPAFQRPPQAGRQARRPQNLTRLRGACALFACCLCAWSSVVLLLAPLPQTLKLTATLNTGSIISTMWLGWDHCGYDTIDDEPQDPESTMSWQPPPSGRGERGARKPPTVCGACVPFSFSLRKCSIIGVG